MILNTRVAISKNPTLNNTSFDPFGVFNYLDNFSLGPNSPAPLTDDSKVTDNSSVNFHDMFFFIFCYNLAINEEKHVMEIYG